jgi:mannosylglycoprotein endo-beta-mannosidase
MASLERTIARQRSRVRWLQEGDANTKLFHAVANGRRTKNFIAAVKVGEEMVTAQERKNEVFTEAYERLIGSIQGAYYTFGGFKHSSCGARRAGLHVHRGGGLEHDT